MFKKSSTNKSKPKSLARQETKTGLFQRMFGKAAEEEAMDIPVEDEKEEDDVTVAPVLACGHSTEIGTLHSLNEDTFNVIPDLFSLVNGDGEYRGTTARNVSLFAVFDGHGGHRCAAYAQKHVHSHVAKRLWQGNHHRACAPALHHSFITTDRDFCDSKVDTSGSCSTCVLIKGDKVYCGNAGDSKAMLIVPEAGGKYKWIDLNARHSADLPSERARILKAGGAISPEGRVYGVLAPSRAFGDIDVKSNGKPVVIAAPEGVGIHPTPPYQLDRTRTSHLVVATDGLWDFVTDDVVAQLVFNAVGKSEQEIAVALGKEARVRGSEDDVTVIVVRISFESS